MYSNYYLIYITAPSHPIKVNVNDINHKYVHVCMYVHMCTYMYIHVRVFIDTLGVNKVLKS